MTHFDSVKECKDLTFSLGVINPLPNKPLFLRVCSTSLLKTLWEEEKLLMTSNLSFSHNVFYPFGELSTVFITLTIVICKLFQFERVYNLSFGKKLTHMHYHTVQSCKDAKDKAGTLLVEGNTGNQPFPFPAMFLYPSNCHHICSHTLSSVNVFNLDMSAFLLPVNPFLAHLSTTCSRGAFRVVRCPSCVVNNFFKHLLLPIWTKLGRNVP